MIVQTFDFESFTEQSSLLLTDLSSSYVRFISFTSHINDGALPRRSDGSYVENGLPAQIGHSKRN